MNSTFNTLPYEIQMQICSYLSSTELHHLFAPVCKKWKHFASQRVLRKDIVFDGDGQLAINSFSAKRQWMENIINTTRKSFKVNIVTFCRIRNWYALSRGLPACNYLRRLEFNNCHMNPTSTKRLVARFPAIEGVTLIFSAGQIDLFVIKQIARWRYLKDILIHVVGDQPLFDKLGTKVVETFAIKCEYLRNFELINCNVLGRSVELLTALRGSTLEKLKVSLYLERSFAVTNRFSEALTRCPKLKVLYLPPNCGGTSFKNNTLLEELYVRTVYLLSLNLREVVLEYLTKLEIVHSHISVQLLPTHCPALKWLAITRNENIHDDDFIYIARCCRNLEHMIVEWCTEVTSKTLREIVNHETTKLNCVKFLWCAVFKKTDDILAAARALKPNLKIEIKQCGFAKD